MNSKIILKNQDVTIHYERANVGNNDYSYVLYLFVGDELIMSKYGNEEVISKQYEKIKSLMGINCAE